MQQFKDETLERADMIHARLVATVRNVAMSLEKDPSLKNVVRCIKQLRSAVEKED